MNQKKNGKIDINTYDIQEFLLLKRNQKPKKITKMCDIYALGAIIFKMLFCSLVEWDDHCDRWTVRINGKNLLVKTGDLLAGDGLMAKWTFVEQGLLQSD